MPGVSEDAGRLLRELVAGDPRVQVRKMFGQPAAFVNGNLCAGTFGRDLFIRLSQTDGEALSRVRDVRRFEPMPGRPMRHYYVLPPGILAQRDVCGEWMRRAIEYALSLPPK